jgi:hypothetical protein
MLLQVLVQELVQRRLVSDQRQVHVTHVKQCHFLMHEPLERMAVLLLVNLLTQLHLAVHVTGLWSACQQDLVVNL